MKGYCDREGGRGCGARHWCLLCHEKHSLQNRQECMMYAKRERELDPPDKYCHEWNASGKCSFSQCGKKHECLNCKGPNPSYDCFHALTLLVNLEHGGEVPYHAITKNQPMNLEFGEYFESEFCNYFSRCRTHLPSSRDTREKQNRSYTTNKTRKQGGPQDFRKKVIAENYKLAICEDLKKMLGEIKVSVFPLTCASEGRRNCTWPSKPRLYSQEQGGPHPRA
jgi:hypothetical protein